MTKKDFELIAETIQGLELEASERRHVAKCFAAALSRTNSRFDTERFERACEPGANVRAQS